MCSACLRARFGSSRYGVQIAFMLMMPSHSPPTAAGRSFLQVNDFEVGNGPLQLSDQRRLKGTPMRKYIWA